MGPRFFSLLLVSVLATTVDMAMARRPGLAKLNAIDSCWRRKPNWIEQREELALCSAGFAGKMKGNIGPGTTSYVVTDPSDDRLSPKPGTLRYGITMVPGKVWITFQKDMNITLQATLLVGSFTTIDGRGVIVHIAHGGCLLLHKVLFIEI